MKTIAIINQKGGVGKTTTTVNLGAALVKRGFRVLLIDLDPQANLTTHLGYEEQDSHFNINGAIDDLMDNKDYQGTIRSSVLHHNEGVDVIPCNIELAGLEFKMQSSIAGGNILKSLLKVFENDYDYCLIDCQPSLNILPVNAMTASDYLLIPVATQGLAVKGLTDLMTTAKGIKTYLNSELSVLGILFTFAEAHTNQTKAVIELVTEAYKDNKDMPIFKTIIPKAVVGGETAMTGQSIFYKNGSCILAQRYMDLADEVIVATKGEE